MAHREAEGGAATLCPPGWDQAVNGEMVELGGSPSEQITAWLLGHQMAAESSFTPQANGCLGPGVQVQAQAQACTRARRTHVSPHTREHTMHPCLDTHTYK